MATAHSAAVGTIPCVAASLSVKPREVCKFSPIVASCLTIPLKLSSKRAAFETRRNVSWEPQDTHRRLRISAAQATETVGGGEGEAKALVEGSLKVLRESADTKKVSAAEVMAAILKIKEAKVDSSDFLQKLGGTSSPGREWRLVFTSSPKDLKDARQSGTGGGSYFPVNAVQTFDAEKMELQNGVFLGPVGSLVFKGRFSWKGRILAFIFDSVQISLGPLGPFSFGTSSEADKARTPVGAGSKDPFFVFDYVDDELVVAQGRGGGVALWKRND